MQENLFTKIGRKTAVAITSLAFRISPSSFSFLSNTGLGRRLFGGEKTAGELDEAERVDHNYYELSLRGWKSYLRDFQTANAVEKLQLWVVGKGLALSCNPDIDILRDYGIDMTTEESVNWGTRIEKKWNLFQKSQDCSIDRRNNFAGLCKLVVRDDFYSGDLGAIAYYDKKRGVVFELVEGYEIKTPNTADDRVFEGLKLSSNNEVVSFFVDQKDGTYKEVKTRNKNNQEVAWMICGRQGKFSNVRGISKLAPALELLSTTDNLVTSIVANARANSHFFAVTEHGINSSGDNKIGQAAILQKLKRDANVVENKEVYDTGESINSKVMKSANATHINLGPDQKFNRYNGEGMSADMPAFIDSITDTQYSTIGIAPEIAKDKFGGSYSSSRMISQTFEHGFTVLRENLVVEQFAIKCFRFWFEINVMLGQISAPKYFEIPEEGKLAYLRCSFRGVGMPHVDPLKEANTLRRLLGDDFAKYPLIRYSDACEKASRTDSNDILKDSKAVVKNNTEFNPTPENNGSTTK